MMSVTRWILIFVIALNNITPLFSLLDQFHWAIENLNLTSTDIADILSRKIDKFTSVFYASVLLLMINCVITLSKWLWNHEPQASGSAVNFDNVMTKFIFNKRTDA